MIFGEINELAAALVEAQLEMPSITKDKTNTFFRSKYADLATVIKIVTPVLAKHGLTVIQSIDYIEEPEVRTIRVTDKKGDTTETERVEYVTILHTMLLHKSGQNIKSTMFVPLDSLDSQRQGSAITYARRYALMAIIGVATDNEDDDGNAASNRDVAPTPTPVAQPQPQPQAKPQTAQVKSSPVKTEAQAPAPVVNSSISDELRTARQKLYSKLEPLANKEAKMAFVNRVLDSSYRNSNELSLEQIEKVLSADY